MDASQQRGPQPVIQDKGSAPGAPLISLPKDGGAIRGIGGQFSANPLTSTGCLNLPIATSPGRSGFGLRLSLSYDFGSGNGPFGFSWSLLLPAIPRKTDQGLPRYEDAAGVEVNHLPQFFSNMPVTESPRVSHWFDQWT